MAGFYSINAEIECQKILQMFREEGYATALPRVENNNIVFHQWSPGDELVSGKFNTQEPSAESAVVTPDVILTPLLAFDLKMRRLGYGGGFYDRIRGE